MENGTLPRKKSKKKKVRSNSPQASNGSDKYFVGFSGRSMRNICEQSDNTEINPEVYSRLAEDATYKVTELINSIKNYSKHSGGRVTFDLTNEVLKDINCAPILGSDTNKTFASVEDDHKQMIYFNPDDETLDLTEEFHKHITEENVNGPVFLTNTYLLDEKIDDDYIEFYQSVCDSIFNGDDEAKNEALEILGTSSHVAGLVKYFLIKWIDMIAVNYSLNMLERSIEFLEAILRNPYTINSDMNIELKHVCQLLVSLLVGSINDEIRENGHYAELEHDASEYATYDANIVSYDGNNGILDNNNGMNLDDMSSDSNMKFDENNAMLIENFSMESEKTGRTLKDELLEGFEEINKIKLENHEDASKDSGSSNSGRNHDIEDEFNGLLSTNCASTIKCSEEYVEAICKLIGKCGSKWYGVENYLTILIISEVDNFLKITKKIRTDQDFDWLGRIAKGLWSLGEFAFRELLQFFDKIDVKSYLELPKFACDINCSAIFLRGKKDIFFYEFLHEVCGDKLMPFLIYYAKFLLNANKRKHAAIISDKARSALVFKINTKRRLIGYRIQRLHPINDTPRPPLTRIISQQPKTINIHYGHKVSTKKMKRSFRGNDEKREVRQNAEKLRSFHQRVVIVKGRYFKPVTNQRQIFYHPNLHSINL